MILWAARLANGIRACGAFRWASIGMDAAYTPPAQAGIAASALQARFQSLLASFPHAFGGNPAISVGLDARQKRSGMTVARAKAQIVPAPSIPPSRFT
jgi:hypothetical protein